MSHARERSFGKSRCHFVLATAFLSSALLLYLTYAVMDVQNPQEAVMYNRNFSIIQSAARNLRLSLGRLLSGNRPKPRILLWNPFFRVKDYLPHPLDVGCPVDCDVTSDRRFANSSDAIVLHLRNTDISDLPSWKAGKQRWVLFNMEAPPHTPENILRQLSGKVHWTATYRLGSDIVTPYGRVVPIKQPDRRPDPVYRSKPRLLCWIVSNCHTSSQRESYVQFLQKFVKVYTYGSCGNLSCPTANQRECYQHASHSCKFYLSFENSLCRDYVTEKVFNALKTDMVPIVLTGADLSSVLPNHSYINALDYGSPKRLVSYVRRLDKERDKYMEFHAWKKEYAVDNSMMTWSCDLCKMLYDSSLEWTTYDDLVSWWIDEGNCSSWIQYY